MAMVGKNMPGNWPREDEAEEEIFVPGLRLRGETLQRTPSPYRTLPILQDQITVKPLRIHPRGIHRNRSPAPYPASPITQDELFIPGLSLPAREFTPESSRIPSLPPANTNYEQRAVPRMQLRVDTLTMQAEQQNIPSPRQLGDQYFSSPVSEAGGVPLSSRRSSHTFRSPSIRDELFFDCSSPSPYTSSNASHNGDRGAPTYLPFQPPVTEEPEPNIEDTDWRRYNPPAELRRPEPDTSVIIESILVPSIHRLMARLEEEDERQLAAARSEGESRRSRRASISARRNSAVTTTAHPLDPSNPQNISTLTSMSELSLSPQDSGYSSSPGTEAATSPPSASRRSLGGLSALLMRGRRMTGILDSINNSTPRILESPSSNPAPTMPPTVTEEPAVECVSCLEDFAPAVLVKLSCHSYCSECFVGLINNALEAEAQWPAKCCLNPIPTDAIITHIDGSMKKRYRRRAAEWAIPAGDRIYCPQPTCSEWIAPKNINTELQRAKCSKCGHAACTTCRGPFHNGGDCPSDSSIRATIDLAEIEGWKRCYSCNALVEHNRGCRHMTCRCKAQFCYICSARWRTCQCTEEDLVRVQAETETRRNAHQSRETRRNAEAAAAAAQAEEERLIIAEVEEFIRQEAEREARIEEEERRVAAEARARREEMRIRAVNLQYHEFRNELDLLHDLQKVPIAERHEFEQDVLRRDRENALRVLVLRRDSEIQALMEESAVRISSAEGQFEDEYQSRRAAEQRIEDNYVRDMAAFWNGKPDGERKVRTAREALRQNQDQQYQSWHFHQREKIQVIADEEAEKMERLKQRHSGEFESAEKRANGEAAEWKRKRWAERRWIDEIVMERGTILQELEQEDYNQGEDMV